MIDWLLTLTPLFKAAHIAGLALWIGGLLTLPPMLAHHHPDVMAEDYGRMRRAVHLVYTCVTGAAVITVIAGTWLIFLRGVFVPWLFVKLACVAVLVGVHAWIGHILVGIAERPGYRTPPRPFPVLGAVTLPVLAILFLVLAKPPMTWAVAPEWLQHPRDAQLPFDVPSR